MQHHTLRHCIFYLLKSEYLDGAKPKIRKISSIKRIDEFVSEIITNIPFKRLIDRVHDLKKRDVNI